MVHRLKFDSCRDIRFSVGNIWTIYDAGAPTDFMVKRNSLNSDQEEVVKNI
jgi:hypothetical protein